MPATPVPTEDPSRVNGPDPRETVNEVLKNLHGSLKWYWQVVMGVALVRAIDTVYAAVFDPPTPVWWPVGLFAAAFVPTFVRFFFGDARYLDVHYIENRKWVPVEDYFDVVEKKISPFRFWTDVVFLLMHGSAFILLGKLLSSTRLFFCVYVVLLLCNVPYLALTLHADGFRTWRSWRLSREFGRWSPQLEERWLWIRNNVVHSLLMSLVIAWSYVAPVSFDEERDPTPQYLLLLALCASNSVIDLVYTRLWYLPRLNRELDLTLRAPDPLGRAKA